MKCWECELETDEIHQHHPVPRVRGGTKTIPLCEMCHAKAHHMDKRMRTSELSREGLAKLKKKKGDRYSNGRPRYGFSVKNGRLIVNTEEWNNILHWFQQYESGVTQSDIARNYSTTRQFVNRTLRKYGSVPGFLEFTRKETGNDV